MKKFEYTFFSSCILEEFLEEINSLGQRGWDAINIESDGKTYQAWFKREVKQ